MEKRNFFQIELEKYERRIKKVSENPDPKLLKSNKLSYELWWSYNKRLLEAWERGEPFVWSTGGAARLIESMGLHVLHLTIIADRIRPDMSMTFFDEARRFGYPADVCDWCQVATGICLSEGALPEPRFAITDVAECEMITQQAMLMARHYKVPCHTLDIPIFEVDPSWEQIEYLTRQLEDLISEIERTVPGAKYDEARHRTLQARDLQSQNFADEIMKLLMEKPCPAASRDMGRMAPLGLDDDRLPEYFRQMLSELKGRKESGNVPIPDEKARLLWLGILPNFINPFGFLEDKGILNVYEEAAGFYTVGRRIGPEVEERYGRPLSLLQQEAYYIATPHWGGPTERRTRDILTRCKQLKIDGLVHLLMVGCPVTVGGASIIRERAQKELGIPTLLVDGWIMDYEKFNETNFRAQMNAFLDLVLEAKGEREGQRT
ncbi:MAG: 2-hydroxyacyl-CoA dehydratase [Chloroflexi bacterium]|nr:2-hydroxyacyl-CoA dehydratase [Chloroflexota bacterium]